ncbi:glucocorticoid modulatory element-binding protein 1 isoform X2 [Denticeps clupeoides]|uniref:glucocorticoid modulatory element-binding protein 1 isoform X2 n=1 Tax=Denticeps clupeoides TaxID=299321 RepID=UPI0010A54E94|nr:glucocorticoid modulatory element-binding protein 1-like isoform X2 [Denticeps clupeoides]
MANAEVTVSMGDMVVVKAAEEDGEAVEGGKAQVILQLQPITPGLGVESGEADTTVVAIDEQGVGEEDEVELGYPITCGESKAVLIFKKFVCPGINVKCVKYEDQLISPKQFVHMSGKATLKDWKRAIRMGGIMLRKMMDSGQLDFYEHTTLCTNTCRSTKFDLLISNTRLPPDCSLLTTPSSITGEAGLLQPRGQRSSGFSLNLAVILGVGNGGQIGIGDEKSDDAAGSVEWNNGIVESTEKKEVLEISEDALNFWNGIADVGLMGEVVSNIRTELLEMLRGVQLRSDQAALQDTEVAVLSNLAQVFGLLDSIKRILNDRRQQTDPTEEQVIKMLATLEQQLDEQKKQQAQNWLALNNMMLQSTPPAKRPPKRPRLQRPASTTVLGSSVAPPISLQPQQFTVISPITLSSVGQPFTVAGLPLATLAQPSNTVTLHTLPGGSQIFTRYATPAADGKGDTITLHPGSGLTLVGTAVQDSRQLGAVVSPMELVQLSQGGGAEQGMAVPSEDTVLVQEEESHTTVIEIDPAPEERHAVGVVELQLEEGTATEEVTEQMDATVMMQDQLVEEGHEAVQLELQTESEEVEAQGTGQQVEAALQLDGHRHLEGLQIMVIEENKVK